MKIEAGKRYVTRNGKGISGVLRPNEGEYSPDYVLQDDETAWDADGSILHGVPDQPRDLIAEYVEPVPHDAMAGTDYPSPVEQRRDEVPYDRAALDALAEVRRAKSMWPGNFNSAHEGYAVLAEEVDELKANVWTNQQRRSLVAMRKEAIQVAAMALRFAAECCDEVTGRK